MSRKLLIFNDIRTSTKVDGWEYFIDSGGWSKISDKFVQAGVKSNFQTNNDGNLIYTVFNANTTSTINVNGL